MSPTSRVGSPRMKKIKWDERDQAGATIRAVRMAPQPRKQIGFVGKKLLLRHKGRSAITER